MKPVYFLRIAVAAIISVLSTKSNAQMVGTNAFLRGQYVEVGIGDQGFYGSSASAPTGYHPHCLGCFGSGTIGFVADVGMDGWATGTPPYMGDYFLPGSPFEGWDMQIKGKRVQGYGGGTGFVFSGGMSGTGANVSVVASGSKVIATWQGTFDSVILTQQTILDTNDLFFIVKITLTNTAVAPKDSIYYFRSLDPDNDETWPGGGFPTHNVILHQANIDTVSVVTATGYSSTAAYLALGTADTASRAVIYNAWPITVSQDLAAVYDGTYAGGAVFYGPLGTDHPGDIAIGLIQFIPHLATVDSAADSVLRTTASTTLHPANTATFTYFYSFGPAATDSAIVHSKIAPAATTPTGIKNMNSTAVKVYPNPSKDYVSITGLTTSDHITLYDMMGRVTDQNWAVGHDGTNTFRYNNVPSGAYILSVTDADGKIKARVPLRKQ
jgi:hypothetical protein